MPSLSRIIETFKNKTEAFSLEMPDNQNHLIAIINSLGFPVHQQGVCFGFGESISEAFLKNDLLHEFRRLALIHYRSNAYESAPKYIEHFKALIQDAERVSDSEQANKLKAEIDDILNYCQNIALIQSPELYATKLGNQQLGQLSKLARSSDVSVESQSIAALHDIDSFTCLLEKISSFVSQKVSMSVVYENHLISLLFQPGFGDDEGEWLYVDPNTTSNMVVSTNAREITTFVFKAHENLAVILSAKTSKENYEQLAEIEKQFSTYKALPAQPSPELFSMCCYIGDLSLIQNLRESNEVNSTPMTAKNMLLGLPCAAMNDHLNVMSYILSQAFEVDNDEIDRYLFLSMAKALSNGSSQVIEYLFENHAELLKGANENGETLIMLSANNHVALRQVLEGLRKQGSEAFSKALKQKSHQGKHALHYAFSSPESIDMLLNECLKNVNLQSMFRDINFIQGLVASFIEMPESLDVFIRKLSSERRLKKYLNMAITEGFSKEVILHLKGGDLHPIIYASNNNQDSLAVLLSFLSEAEIIELMADKTDMALSLEELEGSKLDSDEFHTEEFFSYLKKTISALSGMPMFAYLLLISPKGIATVLSSLTEEGILELLLLKAEPLELIGVTSEFIFSLLPEDEKSKLTKAVKDRLFFTNTYLIEQLSDHQRKKNFLKIIDKKIKSPEVLNQLCENITWLQNRDIGEPIEDSVLADRLQLIFPESRVFLSWFDGLTQAQKTKMLTEKNLAFYNHSPFLLESMLTLSGSTGYDAFSQHYRKFNMFLIGKHYKQKSIEVFLAAFNADTAYDLMHQSIMKRVIGLLPFFSINDALRTGLLKKISAEQMVLLLQQSLPDTNVILLESLIGNEKQISRFSDKSMLLIEMLSKLPSSMVVSLLKTTPAFCKCPSVNKKAFLGILKQLNEEEQLALLNHNYGDQQGIIRHVSSGMARQLINEFIAETGELNKASYMLWQQMDSSDRYFLFNDLCVARYMSTICDLMPAQFSELESEQGFNLLKDILLKKKMLEAVHACNPHRLFSLAAPITLEPASRQENEVAVDCLPTGHLS